MPNNPGGTVRTETMRKVDLTRLPNYSEEGPNYCTPNCGGSCGCQAVSAPVSDVVDGRS